ncbi:DUF58 domain-containing protein [Legionella spiritensis]|uniref:DUF58 domain-containing protein n=1 Tax=Legionella spiritensis TaxID=452 RepID=UPI000F6F7D1F|nr:DUF58 domain-containing protein [Legionella spiritensis]VEG91475.1 Uncharacterized conserved protein (some members contain a von Willebrand factor type A (vWA) domain) [Legionella spiritensis]
MTDGVVAPLSELIALRRYARKIHYKPGKSTISAGNHLSRLRGRGMDFSEVRNYQAGDEIRHMEWRVTARTGRPHIKIYQEERERPVVILTDFNPSMYFGTRVAFKSVLAARLSAMVAWTAVRQGDRVGGLLYSASRHDEFIPRARESGILPWLAALSDYTGQLDNRNHSGPRQLSDALLRMRRVTRPGSILVLISDFYHLDAESEKHLSRLRAHNDVLVYHICDVLELAPPKPDIYAITNGAQEILLDTRIDKVSQDYRNYCEDRQLALQSLCKRLQIQYVTVTAEKDIAQLVRQTFPRRSNG